MKKRKFNNIDRSAHLNDLSAEVASVLSRNNAKASLVIAQVFTVSMAGAGLICSYLLLNVLDYFSVKLSDPIAVLVTLAFIYIFVPPAFASVRSAASALCDGREVSFSEIFGVFASFKSVALSYLPIRFFSWIPKYKKENRKQFVSDLVAAFKELMKFTSLRRLLFEIALSLVTLFIYYILVAGPHAAVRRELILRKVKNINSKNNERTVKRND